MSIGIGDLRELLQRITALIWGTTIHTFPEYKGVIDQIAIAPNGTIFVTLCAPWGTPPGGRLYRSLDGGLTWDSVLESELPWAHSVCVSPKTEWVFASAGEDTTYSIYRSKQNGDPGSWEKVFTNPEEGSTVQRLASGKDGRLFAGCYGLAGAKVYRSTDDGDSWAEVLTTDGGYIYGLAAAPNGYIYVGSFVDGNIYRSTDNGATFSSVYDMSGVEANESPLSFSIAPNGIILCGTYHGRVYRSLDDGVNWTQVQKIGIQDIYSIAFSDSGIGYISYAGKPAGTLYRTLDYGTTVERVLCDSDYSLSHVAVDKSGYLYVVTSRTTDIEGYPKLYIYRGDALNPPEHIPTKPVIYNVTMTLADTEYSQALPPNCRKYEIHLRDWSTFRFAYETGKVATPTEPYETIPAGGSKYEEHIRPESLTLYFASPAAGKTAEIEAWS